MAAAAAAAAAAAGGKAPAAADAKAPAGGGGAAAAAAAPTTTAVVAKPLFARQDELPPLPLPALDATLEKLLKSVRPLVTDEEYEHTESVVKDFAAGVGAELHRALEERAAESRNWLEEWWLEFIYLRPRWPIAVWINYVGANLADELVPYNLTQVQAAAMMTKHVLKFRHLVVSETLEPEKLAGRPLCMDQFSRMFNSCRVPGEECDSIEVFPHDARHIVVMRNNALFSVDVLAPDGSTLPDSDLMQAFEDVLRLAATPFEVDAHPPVSVLTSEERHTWAKARQHLVDSHAPNKATLDIIEKAVFCVTLERTEVSTLQERAHSALLGTGLNRWYDKPFTMIVYPNGITALNGEHTWADAMVIVKQQDYVMRSVADDLVKNGKPVKGALSAAYHPPAPLVFKLDTTLHAAIELAATNIAKLAGSIDLAVMRFTHFGRGFMKRYGFTPDFFVQMAMQLAHWRLHKEFVATYETGHTRLFYHGRTETVRSTSTESIAFCKAMTNPAATDGERFDKLKAAIEAHGLYVKDAMTGQAIDRHLLGLQIAAEIQGIKPKPALFTDPGFLKSRKFYLSTSNVSIGATPTFGGYAPFFSGGYGVCYTLQEGGVGACISHAKGTRTDCVKMRDAIQDALVEMQKLCLTRNIMYGAAAKL